MCSPRDGDDSRTASDADDALGHYNSAERRCDADDASCLVRRLSHTVRDALTFAVRRSPWRPTRALDGTGRKAEGGLDGLVSAGAGNGLPGLGHTGAPDAAA